jgi:hypothetical protein
MAISKLNAEQFSAMNSNFKGVVLEYQGKDGKNSAIHFFGVDYEATGKSQDEMLRVVKNVMLAHWLTKAKETELRQSNDGIRCKLRASTPLKIHIHTDKGETVKVYDLENSEWAKIGLMPTKVDLERSARDQKKTVHSAAVAMLEALKFRVELPKEDKKDDKKDAQKPANETVGNPSANAPEIKNAA